MMVLANLLTKENPALRRVTELYNRNGYAAPGAFLIILGVLIFLGCGYAWWRWRRRQMLQPGPQALLKLMGRQLGLGASQISLLWRLGRQTGREPAATLVCPALLTEMVQSYEEAHPALTAQQRGEIASILDVVTSAAS